MCRNSNKNTKGEKIEKSNTEHFRLANSFVCSQGHRQKMFTNPFELGHQHVGFDIDQTIMHNSTYSFLNSNYETLCILYNPYSELTTTMVILLCIILPLNDQIDIKHDLCNHYRGTNINMPEGMKKTARYLHLTESVRHTNNQLTTP